MVQNDPEDIKREWLFQNEKVCICKAISRKHIITAIIHGAGSIEEVNRIVGCGSGDCQGERCGPKIRELLKRYPASHSD